MNEPILTAEDLTLFALNLLEGEEQTRVEQLLRSSSEARNEVANIRGDLGLFALGAEQHTPSAMTRQRLMKQVARERREVPIEVPLPDRLADAAGNGVRQHTGLAPAPERLHEGFGKPAETRAAEEDLRGTTDARLLQRPTEAAAASASAHSVTMFEQHFAGGVAGNTGSPAPESGSPKEAEVRLRARRDVTAAETADAVADQFVPSNGAKNAFSLTFQTKDDERAEHEGIWTRFFGWSGWAVAAAVAVAAAFALHDDFDLREQLSRQQSALNVASAGAQKAETILQTLQSPASQRFALTRTDAAPVPGGRLAYLPERGTLVFQASNLERLQPDKTYELWLIPTAEGLHPVPAGTFKPDSHGYATLVFSQLPKGMIAGNFGVTVEDEGGATVPTLPILLVGQAS